MKDWRDWKMMKIKSKLEEFKSIMKVVGNINDETSFTFTPTGIEINTVNKPKIVLVIIKLKKSLFDIYDIKTEKTYVLNTIVLNKTIARVGKNELLLEFKDIGLKISNEKGDEYIVKCFAGKREDRPTPKPKHTSKWIIKPNVFFDNIGASVEFSQVGIFGGKDRLSLKIKAILVEGQTGINAEKVFSDGKEAWYDMGYFIFLSSLRHIFKEMEFSYAMEEPAMIVGSNDLISFQWFLAARAKDEEEK